MKNPTMDNPRLLKGRHPCPDCDSSDSVGYYEDHWTCFGACDKTRFYEDNQGSYNKPIMEEIDFEEIINKISDIKELPIRFKAGGIISNYIYEFYGVHSTLDEDGNPDHRYYPWYKDGKLVAYKQKIDKTESQNIGQCRLVRYVFAYRKDCMLWGQPLFDAGGKILVITEGEDDACAIQQSYNLKYKRATSKIGVALFVYYKVRYFTSLALPSQNRKTCNFNC